ncbi:flagellar biosynthesis protein FlhF, partial [Achromobacter denitrificans]|nr:flagellar biosynthesis protein FlhF [Achromobacter denitrificans]
MKISRFFGINSREVMRQVRQVLGPDALIVSNRSVDGGVEVLATVEGAFDDAPVQTPPREASAQPRPLEQRSTEQSPAEPRFMERRPAEPFPAQPRSMEQRPMGQSAAQPRPMEMRPLEPRPAGPSAMPAMPPAPAVAAPSGYMTPARSIAAYQSA